MAVLEKHISDTSACLHSIHTFFGCLQERAWYTDFWLRVEVSC